MYYEDLTEYKYSKKPVKWLRYLNVGWLDAGKEYTKGEIPKLFSYCLFIMSIFHRNAMMGYHNCAFCENKPRTMGVEEKQFGIKTTLGSAEIRVISINGVIYVAPNLIYHYVCKHHYKPPFLFIISTFVNCFFYIPFFLLWCMIFYIPSTLGPKRVPGLYRGNKLIKPIRKKDEDK